MARRSSFNSLITQIARDQAKREREQEKQVRERQRNYDRAQREAILQKVQSDKEAKQRYLESRMEETEDKNNQLSEYISELSRLLEYTLQVDDKISFDSLRIKDQFRDFCVSQEHIARCTLPIELQKPKTLSEFIRR